MTLAYQIGALTLCFICVGLPISVMLYLVPDLRTRAFFVVPVGTALFLFVCGASAALLYPYVPYGPSKLVMVIIIAATVTYAVIRKINGVFTSPNAQIHHRRLLYLILGLSALAITDIFFILGQQGFHIGDTTYFRTPLQSDNERHLILVNAIIRGDGSPFLPGAAHRYQILWHHFAALIVSVMTNPAMPSNYPLVSGVILFTSYVMFVGLFWLVCLVRPQFFQGYTRIFILFALVALHADIFNFSMSWFMNGYFGIEADYSVPEPIFRNFSPKLAALTAPQHALFVVALTVYLASKQAPMTAMPAASKLTDALIPIMVIVSPVMAGLFLPFSVFVEGIQRFRRADWKTAVNHAIRTGGLILLGCAVFWALFRFSPHELFFRDGTNLHPLSEWNVLESIADILAVPAALVAACGTLGVALLAMALWLLLTRQFPILKDKYLLLALTMIYVANFVLRNDEIRRHIAILVFVIALIALLRLLTASTRPGYPDIQKGLLSIMAVVSLLLHGYFVYSYTGKPSSVPSDIPWEDYLCMNIIIQERYPRKPTWASIDNNLRFPLVMEIAPSFSSRVDIDVHSRVLPHARSVLDVAEHGIPPELFMKELGYQLIIWGPIEKNTRILPIPVNLINPNKRVARCGSVELYTLD